MEATPEQTAEGQAVVRVLAVVLERLVAANEQVALSRSADPSQITKFHALKAPGISVLAYLERIHKYASCSTECFVLALIYIDRLIQKNNFLLTELNVHRVVITAVLLAAKFFDDAYYNNAYYAKVGGVMVQEMNSLEVEFLFRINFNLHAIPEVYSKYQRELLCHAASEQVNVPEFRTSFNPANETSMLRSTRVVSCDGAESDSDGQSICKSQTVISEISSTATNSPTRAFTSSTEVEVHTKEHAQQNYRRAISPSPSPTYTQYFNEGNMAMTDHTLQGHVQPQLLAHHDHAQVGPGNSQSGGIYAPFTYDKQCIPMDISSSNVPYHVAQQGESSTRTEFTADPNMQYPMHYTAPLQMYFSAVTPTPIAPSVPATVSVSSPCGDHKFNQTTSYGHGNTVLMGTVHHPSNGYFFHNAHQQTAGSHF
mmetsp:Transcript_36193/g.41992  ORF Transcript_36193/g.41992 Transcript_36193/m.41992 type:complete len:426 (-) Transcript_36193:378-1655(-)|eukprot:CAMPEP_0194384272 /NCGR_PEP_ID=MMETSP0174-20130528/73004_1 /TAXON_ID=216777 /ORGANISM="Proboscia alata, Strain PI-D3" /LENGTH=425 /DNA_ID=CAMNT_0039171307 /DNA_START=792 /DNA_END=2069 /DNA_ORIENTATION=-